MRVPFLLALLSLPAGTALAQDDDPPSGGGMGCVSHGTCTGTVYDDKSNLDSWWYPVCSGCHTPPTQRRITAGGVERQRLLGNAPLFWRVHEDLKSNDAEVVARKGSFATVKPFTRLAREYQALLRQRPLPPGAVRPR